MVERTMISRLTIGVVSLQPGVRILLGQLGVRFEAIARWDAISPADYSAIIINASIDSSQVDAVDAYLKAGGAIIDTGHFLPKVEFGKISQRAFRTLVRGRDEEIFRDIWLVDLDRTLRCHDDARHLDGLVHLTSWGDGAIAYIPLDIHRLLTDSESRRQQFYTPYSRFPNEIVAAVSKGEIRKIFERGMRWLHEMRGLPYIHRWYFPDRLPSIFAYRIDSDYGTREQVLALHDAARRHAVRMTWFVHVEAHREYLEIFKEMERDGAEIGVHCFRHRTFKGFEENEANIREAAHMLAEIGAEATGYAAPNGFWNEGLAGAIDHHRFEYSSEFSLDYDNLPFHPWARGAFVRALQVPAHPVCIGSLLRVKASDEEMKRYFRWIIARRLEEHEPAVLYHHPGHEKADVMEDSFLHARELGLRNITMGEYAAWWRRRDAVRYDASYHDGTITLRLHEHDRSVSLALRGPDGRIGFIDEDGEHNIDRIEMTPAPERTLEMPDDIAKVRRFNPLLLRYGIEDFNSRMRQ